MDVQVQLFKAFSDSTRLRILLLLLQNGELCVCDLMESLQIPQSTISRHLALLRGAGLVEGRRQGVWMHYKIADNDSLGGEVLSSLKKYCSGLDQARGDNERCLAYLRTKGNACGE